MQWVESKAVSCYGVQHNTDMFKVIVSVAAQWTACGQVRLIQATDFAMQANKHIYLPYFRKGAVFNFPAEPKAAKYFSNVFNLLAYHKAGATLQRTQET